MGDPGDICPHLESIGEGTCQLCVAGGPNLWACLQSECQYVGCGESFSDHSTLHAQTKKHNLTVNLTTFRIWCYVCEREVFLEQRPAVVSAMSATHTPHHCKAMDNQDAVHQPVSQHHPLKAVPIAVAEEEGSESEEDDLKPRGLTGMKNIGNSCYMNAALQALSNCPPLTQFFLDCSGLVRTDKKPALCKSYQKLISELWHKKRPSYVVPTSLSQGIKLVNPMFRGYAQQVGASSQQELKEPLAEYVGGGEGDERRDGGDRSPNEDDFLSCDSGASSDRGEGGGLGEAGLLIQDECGVSPRVGGGGTGTGGRAGTGGPISEKERLKEKRVLGSPLHGGSQEMDEDADVDTAAAEEGALERGAEEEEGTPPSPRPQSPQSPSLSPSQTQGQGQMQSNNTPEPDNEASMQQRPQSRPCSPPSCSWVPRRRNSLSTAASSQTSSTALSSAWSSKEDLAKLHSSIHQNLPAKTGVSLDVYGSQGWITYIMDSIRRFVVSCIPSWFWGPMVTLEDCLAAFFAADELKGDNMYSCEKCKKLRNGVKYCKVLRLPEILCIHLKRFRHEVMYSFKINSHVAFPLEGLDLRPFLAKDSLSQITTYDLLSVICHHGTAGSGHYIAYCQNVINGQWYEFDDQYVTEVHETWLNKFNTFTEPGPISNHTFLCQHGGIPPNKYHYIDDLVVILPQNVWEYLYNSFGGGPAVNHLYVCAICQWFREWENFVKGKDNEPPGPIDNSKIGVMKGGHVQLKQRADYGQISEETWHKTDSAGPGPRHRQPAQRAEDGGRDQGTLRNTHNGRLSV
ncbi:unnamed protein product [Coregonus sp. 'balchen']|nr:unnamed protein product [Coregonus sp. 'balchen']